MKPNNVCGFRDDRPHLTLKGTMFKDLHLIKSKSMQVGTPVYPLTHLKQTVDQIGLRELHLRSRSSFKGSTYTESNGSNGVHRTLPRRTEVIKAEAFN